MMSAVADSQRWKSEREVLNIIRRHRLHRLYRPRQEDGQWLARRRGRKLLTARTEWELLEMIYEDFTASL